MVDCKQPYTAPNTATCNTEFQRTVITLVDPSNYIGFMKNHMTFNSPNITPCPIQNGHDNCQFSRLNPLCYNFSYPV